ncbi:MAG: KpsF/GutQ family sugar-phosphate isomerase [candidate division Zixibacteria bacterium]|nr:KpsF/GutQ family sugar-phosphate isomerase [candidate division Zixibacteria bacterium]
MTDYLKLAREVISIEAEAIAALAERLDQNFSRAVEAILNCQGRLIVAGMGKSGLIGKKISATFNSTGIPSTFLHPADAMHGDLGLIAADDVMLLISKSGQMGEIELLLATARRLEITIIGLCGTVDSELYKRADIPLDCSVDKEACPNNLVPTSSSTAALVMGDAIAIAMLKARNFTAADFAALHPGGFLGRRLVKLISEVHHTGDDMPLVDKNAAMKEMILMMTSKRLGCVVIKDDNGKIAGIFTDGDLRRLAEEKQELFSYIAADVMIKNPKSIAQSAVLDAALAIMEKHSISQLPTVDENQKLIGIIHLHDILKSKLV